MEVKNNNIHTALMERVHGVNTRETFYTGHIVMIEVSICHLFFVAN